MMKNSSSSGRRRGAQFLNGVDGIAAVGALFQPRDLEARIQHAGDLDHTDAVLVGRMSDPALVRRAVGGDEQYAIEMKLIGCRAGHGQMGVVYGVERAPEDRDSIRSITRAQSSRN